MRLGVGSLVIRSLVIGVLLSAFDATALAQVAPETPAPRSTTAPPNVTLAFVGDEADVAALEARVTSWFHAQGTLTQSSRVPAMDAMAFFSSREPGVRIWIVLKSPSSVRLFFAVQELESAPRFLVRDVELDGGLDEIGLEQIA